MNYTKELIKYIEDSPSGYHAVINAREMIEAKDNYIKSGIKPGKCSVFTKEAKEGASLVAIDAGENAEENGWTINIIAAHVDSPWLLIDGDEFTESENVLQLPVKPYSGFIVGSWMDRPLTLAGRVKLTDGKYEYFHLKDKTFIMPNMSIHFKKFTEEMVMPHPLYSDADGKIGSVRELLAAETGIKAEDIKSYSVNTVCKEKASVWGENKEYISSPRLDDLACVYTALTAFVSCHNPNAINVLYLCDNEEIGSGTPVGAKSGFLKKTLEKAAGKLGFDFEESIEKSFMISADNAQACHPDHPYIYNPDHKIYMNKGLSSKMSEKYSSTEESLKVFADMCEKARQPHQLYYNRADIPGGGTIGKMLKEQLGIMSVDVGIPQLAMHSAYETMGTKDIKTTVSIFKYFYTKFKK